MAISWISAFRAIPWSDVLSATPSIVQGAEKLWHSVKRKQGAPDAVEVPVGEAARLQQLEAQVAELHREALATSALIKSLAEQNDQLVHAVEVLRLRTRLLLGAAILMLVGLIVLAGWVLTR
ncbi:hypothetical protein QU487_13090 [Crenobacter sp. SG2305]|uniref:hypothetical protein n=1 Tax=Crenobacter oryzisoli TaxID=3056844 RepID=UPI0025AAAD68|nr:hypothetical protein [Crenobacter sp. SG2305]MDN0083681.1 hypothetical protein [Crenobacter sp. SG2305]